MEKQVSGENVDSWMHLFQIFEYTRTHRFRFPPHGSEGLPGTAAHDILLIKQSHPDVWPASRKSARDTQHECSVPRADVQERARTAAPPMLGQSLRHNAGLQHQGV